MRGTTIIQRYKSIVSIVGLLLLVLVFTIMALREIRRRRNLESNPNFALGRIEGCKFLSKSGGQIDVLYSFKVGDSLIHGFSLQKGITVKECETHFVGKYFPVVYDRSCVENNVMLISPEDFAAFDQEYPDSLTWTFDYIY